MYVCMYICCCCIFSPPLPFSARCFVSFMWMWIDIHGFLFRTKDSTNFFYFTFFVNKLLFLCSFDRCREGKRRAKKVLIRRKKTNNQKYTSSFAIELRVPVWLIKKCAFVRVRVRVCVKFRNKMDRFTYEWCWMKNNESMILISISETGCYDKRSESNFSDSQYACAMKRRSKKKCAAYERELSKRTEWEWGQKARRWWWRWKCFDIRE